MNKLDEAVKELVELLGEDGAYALIRREVALTRQLQWQNDAMRNSQQSMGGMLQQQFTVTDKLR